MFFNCYLPHHKFPRLPRKGNKIHTLGQIRYINLMGFSGDVARKDGLTYEVGDAVGLVW